MLTYSLNKKSDIPIYEQLYSAIKNDIQNGVIEGGAKLPSKRSFSEHLGISKITVETAYSMLISEGYVYSIEKKGYYAEKDLSLPVTSKKDFCFSDNSQENYFLDLSSNTVPANQFPFSTWTSLMRNVCLDASEELLLPLPYNGIYELRKSISKYLFEERGVKVDPSQIVVGAGAEYLYSLIIKLLGNKTIYAVEDPTYKKIVSSYNHNGISPEFIQLDNDGLNIDLLEASNASVIHISPSHNFPTGLVYSPKRRNEILQWANSSANRYIIEDDFDSELRFTGKPLSPILSFDSYGKVIYVNTFSKTIAPSVRIGYMVLPPDLSEYFRNNLGGMSCTVSSFEQFTLSRFIDKGYFERHINRTKKYYRILREKLISVYNESKCSRYSVLTEGAAGLHFVLELNTDKSKDDIDKTLKEKGIRISFLSDFYSVRLNSDEIKLLINYSGLTENDFADFLKILHSIIKEEK